MVVEEEGITWMTLIRNYLEKGKLPEDPADARTLMENIGSYKMEDGVLYRKSYLVLLMRCIGTLQANYIIREVHIGSCEMHDGPRQVVAKAMNLGYYWPSMHRDAKELIKALGYGHSGTSPEGPGRVKYLIVATDYFTKWMEAKPLATTIGKQVVNFTWDNIVCKFRIPATIITDNETQFVNDPFKKSLLRGIKTRIEKGGSAWAEEMPNVLWAHRTMKKTNNGETPFSLTYGTEAVIPAEIGMPIHRTSNLNEKTNDRELCLNLDLLEERREIAAIREARYLGPGILVTSEGATCKAPGYLYFYYVSLPDKLFSKYRLAPEAYGYVKTPTKYNNVQFNPETAKVGLPQVLAHGPQPKSCFDRIGPYWFNRSGPNATLVDAGGACISLDIRLANDKQKRSGGKALPCQAQVERRLTKSSKNFEIPCPRKGK
ncbi:reverse transcriptase domain-containing protein [Tanacetum coccineum]